MCNLYILVLNKYILINKRYNSIKKKLSQIQLAEIVDMNFNYIGQIERGEANVTIKTMKNLANALNVELKDLFDFSF